MAEKIPAHILNRYDMTSRQWRALKRKEWREVKEALEKFRLGCAYTPVEGHVELIADLINEGICLLSERLWDGRKRVKNG